MAKHNITEDHMASWSKYQAKKTKNMRIEQKLVNNIKDRSKKKRH